MSAQFPAEVLKMISRLKAEAKEKNRLADELYRHYSGEDPKQATIEEIGGGAVTAVTTDALVDYMRMKKKSARASDLAVQFNTTEERIKELVADSKGKLFIPDWRGWVTFKHK